jgi:hypothetical protein
VREAAEALHDLAVARGEAHEPLEERAVGRRHLGGERGEERHAAPLVLQPLAVLERQVQEHALDRPQRAVRALRERAQAPAERERVGRERVRRVAERVAGELVEQHDQREQPARLRGPAVELAAGSGCDRRPEALGDLAVDRGVLAPPERLAGRREGAVVRLLTEPERQNLARLHAARGRSQKSSAAATTSSGTSPHRCACSPSRANES